MKKLYESTVMHDASDERLKAYDDVEVDAEKATERLLSVDLSEVPSMPVYDARTGQIVLIIKPKQLANQTAYIINCMKAGRSTSFMKPYLEKKIIWSNEANTAFTNGIRIAISPIFAHLMYKLGRKHMMGELTNLILKCDDRKSVYGTNDIEVEKNISSAIYIRFVLIHEIYHMLYQHVRRSVLKLENPLDYNLHFIANVALDLEINRDIVARWPEFEKVVIEQGFLWFKDPKYINKDTNKPFNYETWEDIYDYLLEHQDQVPNQNQNQPNVNNPLLGKSKNKVNLPPGYKDGWEKAVDFIKNKKIDIDKISI